MSAADQDRLVVEDLLTIDVDAELERVAGAALLGAWQAPAELIRHAVGRGAGLVRVELRRRGVHLQDDGAPLDPGLLEALSRLLDAQAAPRARHEALLEVESHDPAFLCLLSLRSTCLRIETGPHCLVVDPPGRTRLQHDPGLKSRHGARVQLSSPDIDAAQARSWIESACRFAPVRIVLGGRDLAGGFRSLLAQDSLEPPLRGSVALTREGVARLWLLRRGIVTAHLTLPDMPPFEAAVEMPDTARHETPAALREAIGPHVPQLLDQAVRLALSKASGVAVLDPADQKHLRSILLKAAQQRIRTKEVLRAPVLPALVSRGRRLRWLSLLDLGPARPIWALYPGQDPSSSLLPEAPVLVLDPEERSRLALLLGVAFRPLRPRPAQTSRWAAWIRAAKDLGRSLLSLGRGRRSLTEASLSKPEHALVDALRRTAGPDPERTIAVHFVSGRGPIRRVKTRGWLLPRENPFVVSAARALARDPASIYPIALAVLGGRALPAAHTREIWLKGAAE